MRTNSQRWPINNRPTTIVSLQTTFSTGQQSVTDGRLTSVSTWSAKETAPSPLVLIVDEDLGFVWWLSEMFSAAGCQVVPALNPAEIVSITRELDLTIDMLVVNEELAGISETIEALSQSQSPKIVAIRDHNSPRDHAAGAHATLERPSGFGQVSPQKWQAAVKKLVKEVQAARIEHPEFS